MFNHISVPLAVIRRRWPWSCVGQKSMLSPIPELKDVNDAVRAYQRPRDFFNSEYQLGLHERADWAYCSPQLRIFTWRFMRALRKRGLPFYVHTCYRDPRLQKKLASEGYSTLTNGAHQRSAAVDIVSSIDHWEIPDALWNYVGTLGEAISRDTYLGTGLDKKPLKIEWGGRWSFYDPAHFQLSDWKHVPLTPTMHEPLRLSPYSDRMRFK